MMLLSKDKGLSELHCTPKYCTPKFPGSKVTEVTSALDLSWIPSAWACRGFLSQVALHAQVLHAQVLHTEAAILAPFPTRELDCAHYDFFRQPRHSISPYLIGLKRDMPHETTLTLDNFS